MQQHSTFVNVHLQDVKHAITGTPNFYFTKAESVNMHKNTRSVLRSDYPSLLL